MKNDPNSRFNRLNEEDREMSYPSFLEHLRARFGRNWVIHRRTARIEARYGKDVVCLSNQAYDRERDAWRAGHPATLLVNTLPDGEQKQFIQEAVRARLT